MARMRYRRMKRYYRSPLVGGAIGPAKAIVGRRFSVRGW